MSGKSIHLYLYQPRDQGTGSKQFLHPQRGEGGESPAQCGGESEHWLRRRCWRLLEVPGPSRMPAPGEVGEVVLWS